MDLLWDSSTSISLYNIWASYKCLVKTVSYYQRFSLCVLFYNAVSKKKRK
jgi:hypothetical protein